METELIRLLVVLGVLAANSYTDVRYRTILGGDRHYACVGGAGLALFLLDGGWADAGALFGLAAGVTLALVLYRCRAVASGDCIILLVISVTLPAAFGIPFLPVLAGLLGVTILAFAVVAYNVALNVSHVVGLYRHPAAGKRPFSACGAAGILKKAAAFFAAHHRRPWERHVVRIDDGRGGFSLRATPIGTRKWEKNVGEGRPVMVAAPVIPFLLVPMILLLLLV
ncbi:MAG: prepilin peptidase [Nitrosopumilaceae archaeon]|nr:prepilin peptidase [Nitrosopumilaceae archaeon]